MTTIKSYFKLQFQSLFQMCLINTNSYKSVYNNLTYIKIYWRGGKSIDYICRCNKQMLQSSVVISKCCRCYRYNKPYQQHFALINCQSSVVVDCVWFAGVISKKKKMFCDGVVESPLNEYATIINHNLLHHMIWTSSYIHIYLRALNEFCILWFKQ